MEQSNTKGVCAVSYADKLISASAAAWFRAAAKEDKADFGLKAECVASLQIGHSTDVCMMHWHWSSHKTRPWKVGGKVNLKQCLLRVKLT